MSTWVTPAPVVAGQLVTGPGGYAGVALHVTGAAAAKVRLWDGTSAAGTIIDSIELAASGVDSWASFVLNGAVRFATGLFVEIVSGGVEGSIRLA
jgi:hypothetical protein